MELAEIRRKKLNSQSKTKIHWNKLNYFAKHSRNNIKYRNINDY